MSYIDEDGAMDFYLEMIAKDEMKFLQEKLDKDILCQSIQTVHQGVL